MGVKIKEIQMETIWMKDEYECDSEECEGKVEYSEFFANPGTVTGNCYFNHYCNKCGRHYTFQNIQYPHTYKIEREIEEPTEM